MVGGASSAAGLVRVILPLLVVAMTIPGRAALVPFPVENGGSSSTSVTPSPLTTITLTPIATQFNNPIGIDHHEPSNQVVMSVNWATGEPRNFELVAPDGTRTPFSNIHGFTDEVKIATVRSGPCQAGFTVGTLFTGTGVPGVIARIAPDGSSVMNPWVTLPNEGGLMRGSLFQDRYCVFGGDLIVVTTVGNVWRVTSAGSATRIAQLNTHLEGLTTVPNASKYGPWAGKILAGAEDQGCLYDIDAGGTATCWALGINPEDVDLILADENFYGVDFSGRTLWGADASQWTGMVGDFTVAQEMGGTLWHVRWNGTAFTTNLLATVGQWEHMTFSPARLPTKNAAPEITSFSASPGIEGAPVTLAVAATDPDGDPLTYRWDFDGDGTWDTPFSDAPTITYTWGDDWIGAARVEVTDGALTALASAPVTVGNVAPTLHSDITAKALVDVTLRVAGEKWHDVTLTIGSGGGPVGTVSVVRSPGSPDDQRVTIAGIEMDLFHGPWSARAEYTPADDPVNGQIWGATPAWITVNGAGLSVRLHHTFNVRQPETWTWTVEDLSVFLVGVPLTFEAVATDPGSDDLTFSWDFGDGRTVSRTYFNDGVGPDPFPSPGGVFPVQVADETTHLYESGGNFTVILNLTDDDGGITSVVLHVLVCNGDAEGSDSVGHCADGVRAGGVHHHESDHRMYSETVPASFASDPYRAVPPGAIIDARAEEAFARDSLPGTAASRP